MSKTTIKAMPKEYEVEYAYGLFGKEIRFVLVDTETGEIVDDAQGYGYTSAVGAHKAYGWKQTHRREKKRK